LYTSPHLTTERDRIRINFEPLSEEVFVKHFFEIWRILSGYVGGEDNMPGYLQLLALLSVRVFEHERVDVAIYEVHAGGRKDATNVFDRPVVCGFTTIGLDHTDILGGTVKDIAWQKSGIMKPGAPAFSVVQDQAAKEVLEEEAVKLGCSLRFVDCCPDLPDHPNLRVEAQKLNASLATCLANAYLARNHDSLSTEDIQVGTSRYSWPGRFHMIQQGTTQWFLDSAHNAISLPVALGWYQSVVQRQTSQRSTKRCSRVLIFGHESKRNTLDLINVIVEYCNKHDFPFDKVILSPYHRYGMLVLARPRQYS
jgi:folylpolyglutamate synthase